MPIYTYRCGTCEKDAEVVQSVAEYSAAPRPGVCPEHGTMHRHFTVPMTSMDRAPWAGYLSPLDGKTFVDSRAKEREMMAVHGVVPFQEIAPDFARNRKDFQKKAVVGIKEATIEAARMVESGYRPKVESEFIPTS